MWNDQFESFGIILPNKIELSIISQTFIIRPHCLLNSILSIWRIISYPNHYKCHTQSILVMKYESHWNPPSHSVSRRKMSTIPPSIHTAISPNYRKALHSERILFPLQSKFAFRNRFPFYSSIKYK